MHRLPRRILPILLAVIALTLAACQVPLPYLPIPTADEETASVQDDLSETAEAEEARTEEAVPDTSSADVVDEKSDGDDAVESQETGVATGSEEATTPAEPDGQEAEKAAVESQPVATILTRSLRIRSGPGAEYETVGGAASGESFPILGQAAGCEWLNVEHPTLGSVWLSGLAEYTSINMECALLADPGVEVEAVEDSAPAPAEQAAAASDDAEAADAADVEPQQELAADPAEDTLPADQGCFLIQNQLGPVLNVTVTAEDREWSDNFQIFENEELPYCLLPGRYSVTIDAPPPWADLNDELTVQAGDRYFWPIRSGE